MMLLGCVPARRVPPPESSTFFRKFSHFGLDMGGGGGATFTQTWSS